MMALGVSIGAENKPFMLSVVIVNAFMLSVV
jgi:hypothetical protein